MNAAEIYMTELRRRLIFTVSVFFLLFAVFFCVSGQLAAALIRPAADLGVRLYAMTPAEKLSSYLRLSFITAIIASAPFAIFQASGFVWPALRRKEKRLLLSAALFVPPLFIAGSFLAYRFLAPSVFRFFLSFAADDGVGMLWSLSSSLDLLYSLMICAGLFMEAPLALIALFAARLLDPAKAAAARPAVIFVIFLIAALCTPPDVVSQLALGIPLWLLFELSLLIGRLLCKSPRTSD